MSNVLHAACDAATATARNEAGQTSHPRFVIATTILASSLAFCDDDRIGAVIEFAEANLDLAAIATGASDELGLGREFAPHSCLDFVLQDLRRFPGAAGR